MSNIIKDMVDKVVGMTPAPAVAKGLSQGSGNAVSGIDTAMAAHADKLHPVGGGTVGRNGTKYPVKFGLDE